ncbi:MAG: LPS assembly protein LptD [Devosiaceae bacterium]|nr:LPS assembly protein LptD [Devosiaceae bacterium]
MSNYRKKSNLSNFYRPLGLAVAFTYAFSLSANASFLPEGFFDRLPVISDGQVSLSSDYLSQNAAGIVIATGQVDISYLGYFATADRLEFNQKTRDMTLIGNAVIRSPDNTEYKADRIELTGNFKLAVLKSMIMVTSDGAMISASDVDHNQDASTILENGTYAPCGTCIDEKGRRIGWRIRTERMIYDRENENLDLEQPILEILGVPIAWLPWIRLPDPSNPRANGIRMPSYYYSEDIGLKLELPYFYAAGKDTDIIFTPAITVRQGPLLSVTVDHRFSDWGKVSATASGLYQLDKSAFAGQVGDKDWRGAIQTSGEFIPKEDWKIGWSYTAFTDPAFFSNYDLSSKKSSVNEIYAQYLSDDIYANVRVQDFIVLGNANQAVQDKQADTIPNARYEQVFDLGADNGRIALSGDLLGINRKSDSTKTVNGVPYILGYEGSKVHGTLEAGWSNQYETSSGLVFSPYLGLRADVAYYDGSSALLPSPSQQFNLTPIAAIDIRYPLIAYDDMGSNYIFEPIVQLVYRGSDVTNVGIVNDNAQNFIFDDANLFSFNRFSGTDRQETGLRANVGARYLANFADGSYLSLVAGQSFMLSGTNSLAFGDHSQAGTSTGLGLTSSNFVVGMEASPNENIKVGAKANINPNNSKLESFSAIASFSMDGWKINSDYTYLAANPALGSLVDKHDIGGSVRVPIDDYWYATAGAGWNITTNSFINHSATIGYDDGFFSITGIYSAGGNPINPTNQTYKVTFNLKGPSGKGYGF